MLKEGDKYGFNLEKYEVKALINRDLYKFEDETEKINVVHRDKNSN